MIPKTAMVFEDSWHSQLTFRTTLGGYACYHFLQMGALRLCSLKSFLKASKPTVNAMFEPGLTGIPRTKQCSLSSVYHHHPHPLTNTKIYFPNTNISCLMKFFSRQRTKPPGGQRLSISLCPLPWYSSALASLAVIHQDIMGIYKRVYIYKGSREKQSAFPRGNWPWSAAAAAETWQVLGIRADWGLW